MSQRLDAVVARKYEQNGETKTAYTNVGSAWPFRDGKPGYTVKLNAIPAPEDGAYTILLFEPKERDSGSSNSRPSHRPASGSGFTAGGKDDDISFEMSWR